MNQNHCKCVFLTIALLGAAVPPSAWAQIGRNGQIIRAQVLADATLNVAPAQFRTADDMLAAEAANTQVNSEPTAVPFRPTMDETQYQQAKAAANNLRTAAVGRAGNVAQANGAPPALLLDGEGVNMVTAGFWIPPDTEGAVGLTQFVEVVNDHIDVFEKSDLATRDLSVSLNSFLGYTTRPVTDPRVIYDRIWNRWIVTADAFPEASGIQFFFIAISVTADAAGPYYIYAVNITLNPGDFWDFPQIGTDQNSVLFTGNVFGTTFFRGATAFAVAKSRLYNGLGWRVPAFTGLVATLAPPIVLDQNPFSYFVAAPAAPPTLPSTTIFKYTMEDSSEPSLTKLTLSTITVDPYSFPPNAAQPGTDALLDTLDNRFVNSSTQVGNSLWQVHSVAFPTNGASTPKFYQFNTATDTVVQTGFFFADNFSEDFNASIAADADDLRTFVTWSSTNALNGTNAEIRFGGCKPSASCVIDASAPPEITSGAFWLLTRWGDYSAITVDPQDPDGAFLVNEYIIGNSLWGSRIAQIHF